MNQQKIKCDNCGKEGNLHPSCLCARKEQERLVQKIVGATVISFHFSYALGSFTHFAKGDEHFYIGLFKGLPCADTLQELTHSQFQNAIYFEEAIRLQPLEQHAVAVPVAQQAAGPVVQQAVPVVQQAAVPVVQQAAVPVAQLEPAVAEMVEGAIGRAVEEDHEDQEDQEDDEDEEDDEADEDDEDDEEDELEDNEKEQQQPRPQRMNSRVWKRISECAGSLPKASDRGSSCRRRASRRGSWHISWERSNTAAKPSIVPSNSQTVCVMLKISSSRWFDFGAI